MIRRILVLGGIGLALAGGARFALSELTERAWQKRRQELHELALFQPALRRPWEVRLESALRCIEASPAFDELLDSDHRPYPAWAGEAPRPLDALERVWVEAAEHELAGLEPVLAELRVRPLDELEWHGETAKMLVLRELVNALCARAWLAHEQGNDEVATTAYADALRLTRATDDGTIIACMIRESCDVTTLLSLRTALAVGLAPGAARAGIAPQLADWTFEAGRAERTIRRDLSFVQDLTEHGEEPWPPGYTLEYFGGVEQALAVVHEPLVELLRARETPPEQARSPRQWVQGALELHELHSTRNVVLTALAVASFREQHGRFPGSLSELEDLAPEDALDPLTGAPLPYALEAGEARIGPAAMEQANQAERFADSLYTWTLR